MYYTLEDYARDLQSKSLPELLGTLNVSLTEADNKLVSAETRHSCKEHSPLLFAELERRGGYLPIKRASCSKQASADSVLFQGSQQKPRTPSPPK